MEMEHRKERLFTLHLMNFMFQVTGVEIPDVLRKRLEEYSPEEESFFTENTSKAIFIFIDNFNPNDFTIPITSPQFKTLLKEIEWNYTPESFLSFLAHYSVKSTMEYYNEGDLTPLMEFYNSTIHFLIKKNENTLNFWDKLETSSKEVVAEDMIKCRLLRHGRIAFNIPMTAENGFVLEVMNFIFDLYMRDLPYYMDLKLDDFEGRATEYLTDEIRSCIMLLLNHQAIIARRVGESTMRHYYRDRSKNSFNEADYLELCVCYTRKAVVEYFKQMKVLSPYKAFDVLSSIIEMAKDSGKFSSFEDMHEAAKQHIDDECETTRPQLVRLKMSKITEPPAGTNLVQRMVRRMAMSKPREQQSSSADERQPLIQSDRQPLIQSDRLCECCTCC